MHIGGVCL